MVSKSVYSCFLMIVPFLMNANSPPPPESSRPDVIVDIEYFYTKKLENRNRIGNRKFKRVAS